MPVNYRYNEPHNVKLTEADYQRYITIYEYVTGEKYTPPVTGLCCPQRNTELTRGRSYVIVHICQREYQKLREADMKYQRDYMEEEASKNRYSPQKKYEFHREWKLGDANAQARRLRHNTVANQTDNGLAEYNAKSDVGYYQDNSEQYDATPPQLAAENPDQIDGYWFDGQYWHDGNGNLWVEAEGQWYYYSWQLSNWVMAEL